MDWSDPPGGPVVPTTAPVLRAPAMVFATLSAFVSGASAFVEPWVRISLDMDVADKPVTADAAVEEDPAVILPKI